VRPKRPKRSCLICEPHLRRANAEPERGKTWEDDLAHRGERAPVCRLHGRDPMLWRSFGKGDPADVLRRRRRFP
jgi:hypothetical protein